jgi:hypothetical protein
MSNLQPPIEGSEHPHSPLTDALLAGLSPTERAHLVHRLEQLAVADVVLQRRIHLARRWFPRFLAVACLVLMGWIVGLAATLPRHYVAGHWNAAWTGFDLVLFASLAVTSWGLWRQRQVAVGASLVTATLLLCDAWFDVAMSDSGRDLMASIGSAVLIEIPLAISLLWLCRRLSRVTFRLSHGLSLDSSMKSVWRSPLPTAALAPRPRDRHPPDRQPPARQATGAPDRPV